CHAVQWDYNAPWHGDRKVGDNFQKHSYPIGIIVNVNGERFVDEGADMRNYTYVKYGREVIKQPRRAAFQIFDQKTVHMTREEYRIREVTKAEADTVEELARKLEIDVDGLVRTVREFNASVQAGTFNPAIKDGKATKGITPPKSNWALPIDSPPYVGFAVTTGITFTFGGLHITTAGAVLDGEGREIGARCCARALRGRRAGGRALLQQLPRCRRSHGRLGLRPHRRPLRRRGQALSGPSPERERKDQSLTPAVAAAAALAGAIERWAGDLALAE